MAASVGPYGAFLGSGYDPVWSDFDGKGTRVAPKLYGGQTEEVYDPHYGIEPTGRPIVQPFVVILSFRDGLMLGERFHYDLASLVRQIGADPIPALSGLDHRERAVA